MVEVENPGSQSATAGGAVSLPINADDPAQQPLTFTATGLPAGLSINTTTGEISGTIDSAAGGSYLVSVIADNGQGNSGSTTFTWTVAYLNQAPVLLSSPDQLSEAGDVVSLSVFAYDLNDDTLTYSATGLPSGLAIDPDTGEITGTIASTAGSATPYSVTVTVSDGTLDASQTFAWFVTAGPVTLTSPGDQDSTEGDTVSLQLTASGSGLTYQAGDLPDGLSIDTATGLISGTVAAGAAADGPYTVTITATDAQGNGSGQQLTWNVVEVVESLTLTNPGSQTSNELDYVELPIEVSGSGFGLSYTAGGLPIGLWIHPITGVISGTIDDSAAEIASGAYTVTVFVTDDEGNTASTTFTWTVNDTNGSPWLAPPSDQYSVEGGTVTLELEGGDWDLGQSVTYSASGLPSGLSIDPASGLISGTITAAAGSYEVTVTNSDGTANTSQTLTWVVSGSSYAPQVTFAINGTSTHRDDLILWGAPAIPVVVTLQNAGPGVHTIELSVPGGRASFGQTVLQLVNGASATILLTALQLSAAEDDVELVAQAGGQDAGKGKLTILELTLPEKISAKNTPAAMKKDRIPPRVWTAFNVTWSVALQKSGVEIRFIVLNKSAANGTVEFLSSKNELAGTIYLQKILQDRREYKLQLRGVTQTEAAGLDGGRNAGKLILRAYVVGKEETDKKDSAGFSVAAIPIGIMMSNPTTLGGRDHSTDPKFFAILWGIGYQVTAVSDSGTDHIDDLDKVEIIEVIAPDGEATGSAAALAAVPNATVQLEPADATSKQIVDRIGVGRRGEATIPFAAARGFLLKNSIAIIDAKKDGTAKASQHFFFGDKRTGVTLAQKVVVPNSGFHVTVSTGKDKAGKYIITVKRIAQKVGEAQPGTIAQADTKPFTNEFK